MPGTNRSVMRAFSILKAFGAEDKRVSISELSRRTALPFGSTYRLLQTLEQTGAVERIDSGGYRLGFMIESLSRNVDIDNCLHQASRDLMIELSEKLDIAIFLGRLQGNMVTFITKIFRPGSKMKLAASAGTKAAAHSLALGRVLLADLGEEEFDALVRNHSLNPFTPHTITNRTQLAAELALVRKQGFAVAREQTYLGIGCVAVPVYDDGARVVAAMSASEDVQNLTPGRIDQLRGELMRLVPVMRSRILPASSVADFGAPLDSRMGLESLAMGDG
jgi:IclR family KDG regulon transcriptional repressor